MSIDLTIILKEFLQHSLVENNISAPKNITLYRNNQKKTSKTTKEQPPWRKTKQRTQPAS